MTNPKPRGPDLIMIDNTVRLRVPGLRETKRVFPDVRTCLDWMDVTVQARPMSYTVTLSDVTQLFNPEQRKVFRFVYDVPVRLRRTYFSLNGYQGGLFYAALHFWWISLGNDLERRLEDRASHLLAEIATYSSVTSVTARRRAR